MNKIILKESELIRLIETAMDLDIYTQPLDYDSNNGNLDVQDSIKIIIERLRELLFMIKQGKKIDTQTKQKIFNQFDTIDSIYEKIKFDV